MMNCVDIFGYFLNNYHVFFSIRCLSCESSSAKHTSIEWVELLRCYRFWWIGEGRAGQLVAWVSNAYWYFCLQAQDIFCLFLFCVHEHMNVWVLLYYSIALNGWNKFLEFELFSTNNIYFSFFFHLQPQQLNAGDVHRMHQMPPSVTIHSMPVLSTNSKDAGATWIAVSHQINWTHTASRQPNGLCARKPSNWVSFTTFCINHLSLVLHSSSKWKKKELQYVLRIVIQGTV